MHTKLWSEKLDNLEDLSRRREDNIKTDLKEDGWEGVNWIYLAQDRNHFRAVVDLRVP
jgi:hypothetical protein